MKKSIGATAVIFPAPVLIVRSYDKDDRPNAAAVSWVLFVFIFAITLFNWRFGSQYVND